MMNRRELIKNGAAAATLAGTLGAIPVAMAQEAAPPYTYAFLMYSPNATPWTDTVVLTISPRGRVTVAPEWTIERAMTDIWPRAGGLVLHESNEFFSLSMPMNQYKMPTFGTPRDETLVAVIEKDGNVEFGRQFEGDETDRAAWREMGRQFVRLASMPAQ